MLTRNLDPLTLTAITVASNPQDQQLSPGEASTDGFQQWFQRLAPTIRRLIQTYHFSSANGHDSQSHTDPNEKFCTVVLSLETGSGGKSTNPTPAGLCRVSSNLLS
jgi:hypothetical protein